MSAAIVRLFEGIGKRLAGRRLLAVTAVLVAECLLIALRLFSLTGHQEIRFEQEDFLVSPDPLGYMGAEDEPPSPGFYVDNGAGAAVITPDFWAKEGVWQITAEFVSNGPAWPKDCISRVVAVDDAKETEGARLVDSDLAVLTDGASGITYRADIRASADFRVVNYINTHQDGQYILMNSVTLTRMVGKTMMRELLTLLFLFALFDLILFGRLSAFLTRDTGESPEGQGAGKTACRLCVWFRKNGVALGILSGIVAFGCFPLATRGIYFGDDIHYHLSRIAFLAEGLGSGAFPVKIYPGWGNGYGYAAGVGYGDLFLLPSAILYLCGFSLSFSYEFYVVLMTALTAWFSYLAFSAVGGRAAGLSCSALYTLMGFRLHSIYAGATVGEYGAYTFLPLVVWGLWEIYREQPDGQTASGRSLPLRPDSLLAAGISLVIGTHVLTTLLLVVSILLFCLLWLHRTLQRRILLSLLKALGKTVLLSLWFAVPLLHYLATGVFRGESGVKRLWNGALSPETLFIAIPDEAQISGGFLGVGLAAFVILAVTLALLLSGRIRSHMLAGGLLRIFILTMLFLWMSTTWFPWHAMWVRLPGLYSVFLNLQFPWHFLDLAAVLLVLLAAVILRLSGDDLRESRLLSGTEAPADTRSEYTGTGTGETVAVPAPVPVNRELLSVGFAVLVIALTVVQSGSYLGEVVREGRSIRQQGTLGLGVTSDYEFALKGANGSGYGRAAEADEGLTAEIISRKGSRITAQVENATGQPGSVRFPLWAYPGYRAGSDAGNLTLIRAEDGRVQVEIPQGFAGTVRVSFREPWFWRLAELISLVTLLVLITAGRTGFGVYIRKPKKPELHRSQAA